MNEFQNGEVFQFGGIHQASTMYLADAAELGRFDAGRLLTLEKEWQAEYAQLPTNDEPFSFAKASRTFEGHNGLLIFMYSTQNACFVLLDFKLKLSTHGRGNVVSIETGLNRKTAILTVRSGNEIAICASSPLTALSSAVEHERIAVNGAVRLRERIVVKSLVEGFIQTLRADVAASIETRRTVYRVAAEDLGRQVIASQERICEALDDQTQAAHQANAKLKQSRKITTLIMAAAAALVAFTYGPDWNPNTGGMELALFAGLALSALVTGLKVLANSTRVQRVMHDLRSGQAMKFIHHFAGRGPGVT